jgi:hypothetical protein
MILLRRWNVWVRQAASVRPGDGDGEWGSTPLASTGSGMALNYEKHAMSRKIDNGTH